MILSILISISKTGVKLTFEQDIKTVSGDVTISGNVSATVKSISGDIRVNGNVSGNLKTVSGDLFTK